MGGAEMYSASRCGALFEIWPHKKEHLPVSFCVPGENGCESDAGDWVGRRKERL
jgi:hypothetical protein